MSKENIILHSVKPQVTDIKGTAEVIRKIRETCFQVMEAMTSGDITHKQVQAINKLLNKCIAEIKKTGGSLVAVKDANGVLGNIHDMLA